MRRARGRLGAGLGEDSAGWQLVGTNPPRHRIRQRR